MQLVSVIANACEWIYVFERSNPLFDRFALSRFPLLVLAMTSFFNFHKSIINWPSFFS